MKILFQGDSITDCGRDYGDSGSLGEGYPKFAAIMLDKLLPDAEFAFFNRGISGNRTRDLLERARPDIIDIRPDIVSVLIGINDVWRHFDSDDYTPDEEFEKNYESVLKQIKSETGAKIIMIEPFFIGNAEPAFREELNAKITVVRRLGYKYADKYIPMDGLINAAAMERGVTELTFDGVHPADNGAHIIAAYYVKALLELIPGLAGNGEGEDEAWKN